MTAAISPYNLPEAAESQFLTLAAESDLLVIGELHGNQEVPRLVVGLLPALTALGYGGLALDMHAHGRRQLLRYAQGQDTPPPKFKQEACLDGRASAQRLSMIQQTLDQHWDVLCFDMDLSNRKSDDPWSARDGIMGPEPPGSVGADHP